MDTTENPDGADSGWLRAGSTDADYLRGLYDDWASTYNDDLGGWEYRAPSAVASMLAEFRTPLTQVLDVGCGTGMSGLALRTAGFNSVVGCDLSPKSIELASATGAYASTFEFDMQRPPLPFADNHFEALVCVGVMTYLPDTAEALREFCRVVRPQGVIVFTQREDVWSERGCGGIISALEQQGCLEVLRISDPQPYLPLNGEMGDIGMIVCAVRSAAA